MGELREQLLFSIQPFITTQNQSTTNVSSDSGKLGSGDRKPGNKSLLRFMASNLCGRSLQHHDEDFINGLTVEQLRELGAVRERMTTDLRKLRRNYEKMARNRQSTVVVMPAAYDEFEVPGLAENTPSYSNNRMNGQQSYFHASRQDIMNHLLQSKDGLEEKNQTVLFAPILEFSSLLCNQPSPISPPTCSKRKFYTSTIQKQTEGDKNDSGFASLTPITERFGSFECGLEDTFTSSITR